MDWAVDAFDEHGSFARLLQSLQPTSEHRALEVGCGYGEKMRVLQSLGIDVTGVDINPWIVQTNRANGLKCMTPEEFDKVEDTYDILIMSHVIEHFVPSALLEFMEHYLARLKNGGHLLIISPLAWPAFFHDFHHIRPYPPFAIQHMFGRPDCPQAALRSRFVLKRLALRLRRSPILLSQSLGLYLWECRPTLARWTEGILRRLYKWSGGFIGQTTGWMGLYRKTETQVLD
jgi:SAM-dependent methyltransferase